MGPSRVCCVLLLVAASHAATVTPMEKVIKLLKSLDAKVTAEGKKEAAQYDKFACFCKEQADEKLYAIEKSEDKIAQLKATIGELDTAIAALNSDISDLSKRISELESEIDTKTKKREKEHDAYLAKAKDMNEAIDAAAGAIEALKNSKTAMKGAKVDLAQVNKVVGAVSRQPSLSSLPAAVSLIEKLEAAPKFEYQSNDIIATLEDLLATFKKMKKDLDVEEFDINAAFESDKLGLSNEKKFKEKDRAEKQAVVEAKTDDMETAKSEKDEETKDMDSDQAFLDEITKQCEEKALLFDQRSKTRGEELKALNDAVEELQKGAVPNFEANKKLVGIQRKAVVEKAKVALPASFVQIDQHKQSGRAAAIHKVLALLKEKSRGSGALASVALRIKMSEDHFVKVRGLIKDLIAKLKADALAEADQKSICDKGMKKAVSDRDEANGKIEAANGKISTYTANQKLAEAEVAETQQQIAQLKKELLEATELRDDDKADNTKTLGEAKEGIESVKLALGILKDFYEKAMLAQTGKYVPPKSDRDGNTVGDLAPEVFDEKYKGSQSESKGIVGILEVILSDFERTQKKTESDEKDSKEAFETLEKETKADIGEKEKKIKKLEGQIADLKSDILDQKAALKDAKELLDGALESLESLQAMCVAGEETWEERKKKREDEVEALKDALDILENWQK